MQQQPKKAEQVNTTVNALHPYYSHSRNRIDQYTLGNFASSTVKFVSADYLLNGQH